MAKKIVYVVGQTKDDVCSTHKTYIGAFRAFNKCQADMKGHKIWKKTTVPEVWERV